MRCYCLVLLSFTWILFASVANANLIDNGDFSSGNTEFNTGYVYTTGNIHVEGYYSIVTDPLDVHTGATSYGDHTTGTGLMMVVNGSTTPNSHVWSQTVNVSPGTEYVLSLWVSSWAATVVSIATFSIEINSVPIGSNFDAPSVLGQWEEHSLVWNSATSNTAQIRIINSNAAGDGNDYALDDITFVPDPGTLLLLAFGGLGVMGRRRNAQH